MKNQLYHYTECGLENIYLLNGFNIDEDGSLMIENIDDLHKAIANHVIRSQGLLNGSEIRFIRHYLDLSQKRLAELLGKDSQSVLRWENGKTNITPTADRLLRAMLSDYVNDAIHFTEFLATIADLYEQLDDIVSKPYELHDGKWGTAA